MKIRLTKQKDMPQQELILLDNRRQLSFVLPTVDMTGIEVLVLLNRMYRDVAKFINER
jgi:hypothetical protein